MQQSSDSHIIKAPHHSNPSTPKSVRNTAHSNPRPSDQKPQAPMEAMDASGSRLCQIIQGVGLRPRTAQRFQTVLATASIVALADAGFASRMDDMMVNSIRKFTAVKKRADDLVVLLQPAPPGSSLPATLIGLHGDKLFQALVALQVPEVATKNVHLEAALAADTSKMHHYFV